MLPLLARQISVHFTFHSTLGRNVWLDRKVLLAGGTDLTLSVPGRPHTPPYLTLQPCSQASDSLLPCGHLRLAGVTPQAALSRHNVLDMTAPWRHPKGKRWKVAVVVVVVRLKKHTTLITPNDLICWLIPVSFINMPNGGCCDC